MNQPALTHGERSEPNSLTKCQSIIAGAAEVFLRHGYGNASMEAIALEAKVSKQTIYAYFEGKDALFEAIVREKCDEILFPTTFGHEPSEPLETVLQRVAESFLLRVLSRDNMRLFRIIVSECGRFPELADAFYRSGPRLGADQLARFLDMARQSGELKLDDPRESAEAFFSLLRGDFYMRRLLGIERAFDDELTIEHARKVVALFMRAHTN